MSRCIKCDNELSANAKFCEKCGAKVEEGFQKSENERSSDEIKRVYSAEDFEMNKKKRNRLLTVLLQVCYLPIMAMASIPKKMLSKLVKGILIVLIIIFLIGMIASNSAAEKEKIQDNTEVIMTPLD